MKKITALLIAVFVISFAASSGIAAPKKFTIGNDAMEDSVTTLISRKLAELIDKKSNGQMKADVFVNAQLGSDPELAQSCRTGDVTFIVGTTAPLVNFVPKLAIFDTPIMFKNIKVARKAMDKMLPVVAPYYDAAGYKILGYGDQGFREMSTNKPVRKFGDFKGQKIRTMANPNHIAFWRALGANPAPLAMSEVYISLQQGAIDAQENPYEVIVSSKLYEQQKYVVNTNHIFHAIEVVMSKKVFDTLSKPEQKIVIEAGKEAAEFGRQQADKRNVQRLSVLKQNKCTVLDISPELRKEMLKAAQPVYQSIRKTVGGDLFDKMQNAIKEAEK
jgi:tripartite ATP-independent transporter DctP family solute receptor